MTPADLAKLDVICALLDELRAELQRVPPEEHYPYLGALAYVFRYASALDQDKARAERLEDAASMAIVVHEHMKRQQRGRSDIN